MAPLLTITDPATLHAAGIVLDDAIVEGKDLSYSPETGTFTALLERETGDPRRPRAGCQLTLRRVLRADIRIGDDIPSLLMGIRYDARTGAVRLGIGGQGTVILYVEALSGEVLDIPAPPVER